MQLTLGQVPVLPQMGPQRGAVFGHSAGARFSRTQSARVGRLPGEELGTQWPGLAPCERMLFLSPSSSLISAGQRLVLLFAER